jgi:hypothetical protein
MAGGKKEHVEKVKKSKFNRQRTETNTLRSNCGSDGYVFTFGDGAAGQCEFHHVLPISSLQDGVILPKMKKREVLDFVHKCMALTKWDINEQPNLLGLPTKKPYLRADKLVAEQGHTADQLLGMNPQAGAFGALPDLPCHMNDHDKFTQAVINNLNTALWPELIEGSDLCKDPGKDIRALLESRSNQWKNWLKKRGEGAADSWVNREQKKNVWYIPLSMAPAPTKTDPPPNIYKLGKRPKIRQWLETIFSWAG